MEELDLPLNLNSAPSGTPVFTGGISVDNMSWWFWIKAGMGLAIGVMLMGLLTTIAWLSFLLFAGLSLTRALGR